MLHSYHLLDTAPERELDELAKVAAEVFKVPIAAISLLDEKRTWFKSKIGLEIESIPRSESFCHHAAVNPKKTMVVADSLLHPVYKDLPVVTGSEGIRFYAGAPLQAPSGHVLGTLCVMDRNPRQVTEGELNALETLARKVMDHINSRKLLKVHKDKLQISNERLIKIADNVPGGLFQLCMSSDGTLRFEFISKGMVDLHPSLSREQWIENPEIGFDLIHVDDVERFKAGLMESYEHQTPLSLQCRVESTSGYKWHLMQAKPHSLSSGEVCWYGSFQDISKQKYYEEAMEQVASDISHVLRKPVANLLGLAQAVAGTKNLTKADLMEYVEHIKTVSEEMDQFTQELNKIYQQKKQNIFSS